MIPYIPIRMDIEVLPADEPPVITVHDHLIITSKGKLERAGRRLKLGWTVKETIGMAIVNPRGVARGSKSTIVK